MIDLGVLGYPLAFLAAITIVVFFHELGHYWVARRSGVAVEVFSIGFGPELFGWQAKSGTYWRVGLLPLGGYVRMRGDENAASMASEGATRIKGSFAGAPLLSRMAIISAGPLANFLLGIMLFAIVYMAVGKAVIPAEIGEVMPETAAAEAGLQEGDKVLSVDGRTVRDFAELRSVVFESPDKELLFEIDRFSIIKTIPVTPRPIYLEDLKMTAGQLGVRSAPGAFRKLGLSEAAVTAGADTFHMTSMMLRGIGRLVTGNASQSEVGGPVRIAEFAGDAARQGFASFLIFTAVISINLGLINLLPVPVLDGGHLLMFMIEGVRGKPLPERLQSVLMRGGMAILMSLMIVVTFFDLFRFVSS